MTLNVRFFLSRATFISNKNKHPDDSPHHYRRNTVKIVAGRNPFRHRKGEKNGCSVLFRVEDLRSRGDATETSNEIL